MKKGDIIWLSVIVAIGAFLAFGTTRELFEIATKSHPYIMGFFKFMILATMGELLAIRIVTGQYNKPVGMVWKAVVWGFIGVLITLMFNVFAGGVMSVMKKGLLPFAGSTFAFAFFTSAIMNLLFAPTFMGIHKYTDAYIELRYANGRSPSMREVVDAIDFYGFVSFVLLKTIPLFWIPIHTITFLLPAEYRVIMAAGLSIVLGAILSFSAKSKH